MVEASEVCTFHRERMAVTFCRSCNRPICRECVLTDQIIPRFYFSFWSSPNYRCLCPSCYIKWHESNAEVADKARLRRVLLWVIALLVGFGAPILVEVFSPELFYSLPLEIAIIVMRIAFILIVFSLVFLIPYFLLFIVMLRKLRKYPKKARIIASSTAQLLEKPSRDSIG